MSFIHKKQNIVFVVNNERDYIENLKRLHELANDKKLNIYLVINMSNQIDSSDIQSNTIKIIHYPSNRKCEIHFLLLQLTRYFKTFKYYFHIKDLSKKVDHTNKGPIHAMHVNNHSVGFFINSEKIRKEIAKDIFYINRFRTIVKSYLNYDD